MEKYPLDYSAVRDLNSVQLFGVIDDWLNCHGGNKADSKFIEALMSTHRTLQQMFVNWMFSTLVEYGRKTQFFDLRNEASVQLCKKLAELVDSGEIESYMPFI